MLTEEGEGTPKKKGDPKLDVEYILIDFLVPKRRNSSHLYVCASLASVWSGVCFSLPHADVGWAQFLNVSAGAKGGTVN